MICEEWDEKDKKCKLRRVCSTKGFRIYPKYPKELDNKNKK